MAERWIDSGEPCTRCRGKGYVVEHVSFYITRQHACDLCGGTGCQTVRIEDARPNAL